MPVHQPPNPVDAIPNQEWWRQLQQIRVHQAELGQGGQWAFPQVDNGIPGVNIQWGNGGYQLFHLPQPAPEPEEPDNMPPKAQLLNSYKVGCDPEFVLVNRAGNLEPAAGKLPHLGRVGFDHGGRIVEIRPSPSRCIRTLIKNIRDVLVEHPALAPCLPFKWRAGALFRHPGAEMRTEPLGGHVHIDIPWEPETAGFQERVRALDRLTLRFEELDILPRVESEARRGLWGKAPVPYGNFGNIRAAGRGERQRLEYRTPASWLFSPAVAFACLTGWKLAVLHPKVALETLDEPGSSRKLRKFFSLFKVADDDAAYLCETLGVLGNGALQGDPDANVHAVWAASKI